VTLMKRGKKIVVGSQEGVLSIFDMANMVDISDRFPGHPQSVDALVAVSEDLVLTGSSDGVIRVISILPNKMLGIVGEHSDWPVERLALSPDGNVLASAVRAAQAGITRASHATEACKPRSRTTTQ
jgi:WD40 repeat protein